MLENNNNTIIDTDIHTITLPESPVYMYIYGDTINEHSLLAMPGWIWWYLQQSQERVNLIHPEGRGDSQTEIRGLERLTYPFVEVNPYVTESGHPRAKRNMGRPLENTHTAVNQPNSSKPHYSQMLELFFDQFLSGQL